MLVLGGSAAAALVSADRALAAPQPPAPVGDDIGFLTFGAVAEGVLVAYYTAALALDGAWSDSEHKLLGQARERERDNVERLNAALGELNAIPLDSFKQTVKVGSRGRALQRGRELETLVGGVYLNGVGYVGRRRDADPASAACSRVASRHNALLTRLAGLPLGGLPSPIDLDAAGTTLDKFIEDPT